MTSSRPLRVLLVANDGFSAGHVARMLAVAAALERRARARGVSLRAVLATTSEAHDLLRTASCAVVRLPAPAAARQAGFSDLERRRLVRGAVDGVVSSFAPDLVVVDTFPSGPHGELAGLCRQRRSALVRRAIPDERRADATLTSGIEDYDLAIQCADPDPVTVHLPIPTVHVPPITLVSGSGATRAEARAELGLPKAGRVVLVTSGGGGDPAARERARTIAGTIARLSGGALGGRPHGEPLTVALAAGPLATDRRAARPLAAALRPTHPLATDGRAARLLAADGRCAGRPFAVTPPAALTDPPAALTDPPAALTDPPAADRRAARPRSADPYGARPLAAARRAAGCDPDAVCAIDAAPLEPLLAAFDGAFAAAGYNTAHALAAARVPAILFASPRPFDDQAARAARFARAGFARFLERDDDDLIASALAWLDQASPPHLVADGADRTGDALLDLVGVPRRTTPSLVGLD